MANGRPSWEELHAAQLVILKALGLGGQPIRRLVLDLSADDAPRIWVERYLQSGDVDKTVEVALNVIGRAAVEQE